MSETKGEYIAMQPNFYKPAIGAVVAVEAVDWGIFNETYQANTNFAVVRGTIYGTVVKCDDELIALAFQVFDDGGLRFVLSVPWVTVEKVTILEHAK